VNWARDAGWNTRTWTLRAPRGERITVRPMRSQDAGLLQAYVRGLSTETRHNRFLGALGELSLTRLEQLIRIDGPGEVALLAFLDADESQVIAEAILANTPNGHCSEIAVSVADAWQGRGVGRLILRNLECRAKMAGARLLYGDVLRTNTAMKCLARKEGFSIRPAFTDARLIEVRKDFGHARTSSIQPIPRINS
jgi:GNAT superfamily N-acetyltransferase